MLNCPLHCNMSNFQIDPSGIEYSAKSSNKRLKKASALIGEKMVKRIIGLALYLLGANRNKVSENLNLPLGTFFTLLTRFHKDGTGVFTEKTPGPKPQVPKQQAKSIPEKAPIQNCLNLAEKAQSLKGNNPLQHKVLMLTFLNWEIISCKDAAESLEFSEQYTRSLAKKLKADDVDTLVDKRQGQQQDYHFNTDVKAELIQQFSFNIATGKNASSKQLCQQVNEACGTDVTDRTIRLYMNKFGLPKIKKSLFDMLTEFKKNSQT